MRLLLLLVFSIPAFAQFGTASAVQQINGTPSSPQCTSANNVGQIRARKDGAAANSTLYVCSNTGVGVYEWALVGSGGGTSTANPSATTTGASTTVAVDITALNLSTKASILADCYTGATTQTPLANTWTPSGGPPFTTVTFVYASTANVTCSVNATGGAGPTGATGATGATGPSGLLSGTLAAIPATCTTGASLYQATDQPITTQIYACTGTNTWTRAAYTQGTTAPATCTIGQMFFDTDSTAGSNLQLCTASNTWTTVSGSGGTGFSYEPTRTSATVLTLPAIAAYSIRVGNTICSGAISSGATFTVSSGTGTLWYAVASDCTVAVRHNIVGSCSAGCTAVSSSSGFALSDAILGEWAVTSGSLASAKTYGPSSYSNVSSLAAGTNISFSTTAGVTTISASGGGSGCTTSGSSTQVLTDNGSGGCTSNAGFLYTGGIATLGTAGSVVGKVALANATSGTVTLQPVTGALGTSVISVPAATDTMALLAATQTMTNKDITGTFTGNLTGNITGTAPAGTLTGTTLAATVVTSSLTSVGTITTGVWTGTAIGIARGGTGQSTATTAFNALSPVTTRGDIIVGGTAGTNQRLAKGTQYQTLQGGATDPGYAAVSLDQATAITGILPIANGGTGVVALFATNAQTSTYQVLAADFAACKTITIASGTFTITLVASGSQPTTGQCITILNYGTGVPTLARSGQNLNGAASNLTGTAGSASIPTGWRVYSNGTDYIAEVIGVAGSGSGTVSSGTTNTLSKYTGSTTVGNSLWTDDGTTTTYSGTGGIAVTGSVGGTIELGQGTAPSLGTNSVKRYAPTSISTAYGIVEATAAATGFGFYTNSSNVMTTSYVSANGSGNVLLSAGTAAIASGKTLTVSNSLTLAGTDSTVMTFPSTSATIARTDAANIFTGVQTMTSPALTTPAITGAATWQTGVRQTFNPNGTTPGFNVGSVAGDPSTPSNGDLWYNSSTPALRARINGATVSLGAGGTGCTVSGGAGEVLYSDGAGNCTSSTDVTYSAPNFSIGTAGGATYTLKMFNATSGSITVRPVGGALGTITTQIPAVSGTILVSATSSTAGQIMQSTSTAGAPAYSTATYPLTTTANRLLYSSATNTVADLATANGGVLNTSSSGVPSITPTPVLGLAGTTVGTIGFQNATSGTITLSPPTGALGTVTLTLPATTGNIPSIAGTLAVASGKTATFSNTITFAGTDSTTMTFPSTTATLARTDAANTFTGVQTMTSPALTTPAITGLATGSGVASAATASTLVTRDSSANISANSHIDGYTTTATAAGTTTLTVGSTRVQYFTGTTTQTVTLPVTSTMVLGQQFEIHNNSTGLVTVQSSGSNSVKVLGANTAGLFTVILTSGTSAASWDAFYYGSVITSGKVFSSSNTLTLAGTDGTTMTFPSTSATIARTDAANTFTGTQTFTAPVLGTPASATLTNATGLPVSTGISGLGTGVATFLATPSGANFNAMITAGGVPIVQNSKSAAYTTVLSDCMGSIYHPSADTTARTWTIDSNANVAAPIGCTITFVNDTSAGVITISITSDTLVLAGAGTTGSRTLAASGVATATKVTSTRWIVNGTGLT